MCSWVIFEVLLSIISPIRVFLPHRHKSNVIATWGKMHPNSSHFSPAFIDTTKNYFPKGFTLCCYHADVPAFNDVDVSHQVLPGQQALHVHKQRLPHVLQPLEVSIQPEEREVEVSLQRVHTQTCACVTNSAGCSLTHPATLFTASLLVGGIRKQIDGTDASLPLSFSTFHL